MSASRDELLDRLITERQLLRLSYDFCRGVDRGDTALLETLYWPGAADEHGFNATNTARELIDALPVNRRALDETQHHVTTHAFEIDGDRAEGEVYVVAYHRFTADDGPTVVVIGARFLDKYDRRDGIWRISHRRAVESWSVKAPAPQDRGLDMVGRIPRAGIGADDPAHTFFDFEALR